MYILTDYITPLKVTKYISDLQTSKPEWCADSLDVKIKKAFSKNKKSP